MTKKTILGSITNRVIKTYDSEMPMKSGSQEFILWVDHWINTAEKMKQEFIDEGLVKTAAIVQEHINWTKKLITNKYIR